MLQSQSSTRHVKSICRGSFQICYYLGSDIDSDGYVSTPEINRCIGMTGFESSKDSVCRQGFAFTRLLYHQCCFTVKNMDHAQGSWRKITGLSHDVAAKDVGHLMARGGTAGLADIHMVIADTLFGHICRLSPCRNTSTQSSAT